MCLYDFVRAAGWSEYRRDVLIACRDVVEVDRWATRWILPDELLFPGVACLDLTAEVRFLGAALVLNGAFFGGIGMVVATMNHWTDSHGNRVVSGGRYAVGRGAKVKKTNQMTVYEHAETGDWFGDPRDGGADVRLGVPGEQDAQGESAKLAFVPLGDDWEEIAGSRFERESVDRRNAFDRILIRATKARDVLSKAYDELLDLACDKLSEEECDKLHGKIYNDSYSDEHVFEIVDRPFMNA